MEYLSSPGNPLNPINNFAPVSVWSKEKHKLSKEDKKKLIIKDIKKQLDSKEFRYLKMATNEFDLLKKNLEKIGILKNDRAFKILKENFYKADNSEKKYERIKKLNDMINSLHGKNKKELLKEISSTKFWSEYEEVLGYSNIIEAILLVIGAIVTAAFGWFVGPIIMAVSVVGTIGSIVKTKENFDENTALNTFYDKINDIYPDVTKEEFQQIVKLFDKGKLDYKKLRKILSKFYEDGKITKLEHRNIEIILNNLEN